MYTVDIQNNFSTENYKKQTTDKVVARHKVQKTFIKTLIDHSAISCCC